MERHLIAALTIARGVAHGARIDHDGELVLSSLKEPPDLLDRVRNASPSAGTGFGVVRGLYEREVG